MQIGSTQHGTLVAGTHLLYLGPAPRRSARDRNRMGWYECTACDQCNVMAIRVARVKPGSTISCGCVGKKLFVSHYEQRAHNLLVRTQREIFRLAKSPNRKRRLTVYQLMGKYKLDRYVIGFVLAARAKYLKALPALRAGLNTVEQHWLARKDKYADTNQQGANRNAYLKALSAWDRSAYLALELKTAMAKMLSFVTPPRQTAEGLAELMEDLGVEVEFVEEPDWTPLDMRA